MDPSLTSSSAGKPSGYVSERKWDQSNTDTTSSSQERRETQSYTGPGGPDVVRAEAVTAPTGSQVSQAPSTGILSKVSNLVGSGLGTGGLGGQQFGGGGIPGSGQIGGGLGSSGLGSGNVGTGSGLSGTSSGGIPGGGLGSGVQRGGVGYGSGGSGLGAPGTGSSLSSGTQGFSSNIDTNKRI